MTTDTAPLRWQRPWWSAFAFSKLSGIYLWIAIIVVFAIWIPHIFLTPQTAIGIAGQQAITVIVTLGLLFNLAAGGLDLSVAQNLGLSAVIVATLSTVGGWPAVPAAIAAVVVSTVIGLVNGYLVAHIKMNSLIATLGMSSVLLALTEIVSAQKFRGPVSSDFAQWTQWQPLGIPGITIYAVVLAFVAWYVLEHTPFGRRTYATGANPEAALLAGVKTHRYLLASFVITGFAAGLAGVLLASRIQSVGPTVGPSYLLPAFAACFLGTTQLKPGKFNVWGTVLAIYLLATGVYGLQLVGGQQWITDLFNGIALIVAVGISLLAARRAGLGALRGLRRRKGARG